ncbi:MAG: hypothetical protein MJ068_04785 [Clostridia bacterium]|nr:hypothetical protein [Clostridia bacterium]
MDKSARTRKLRYSKTYFEKHNIKEIKLRMPEDVKKKIQEYCTDNDISVNAYIMGLIKDDLNRIARERIAEDLEQWKEARQLEEDNELDEPITLTALDVDVRDFESIADAVAEAKKRAEEFYDSCLIRRCQKGV